MVHKTKQSLFHPDVLQISPTDNNGTHGSMNHILRQPYYIPELPAEQSRPGQCPLFSLDPVDNLGCSCPALVGIVTLIQYIAEFSHIEQERHNYAEQSRKEIC